MARDSEVIAKLRVFISYSRDDLAFADQLVAGLKLCGFEPTIDRHEIQGGEPFKKRLEALIADAATVVFVLSPTSVQSEHCVWEVQRAVALGKRIVPIVCQPLGQEEVPDALSALDYIFFYAEPKKPGSGFGAGLSDLVTALETDLDWIREHTRLFQRAIDWDAAGRATNRLLSGSDVAAARDWAERRPSKAPPLTTLHLDFIRASENDEEARNSAERKRLEDMAVIQADRGRALERMTEEIKKRARLRALAFTALTFVSLFAVWQWMRAAEDRDRANVVHWLVTADQAKVEAAKGNTLNRLLLMLEARTSLGDRWFTRSTRAIRVGVARALDGMLLPAPIDRQVRHILETARLRTAAIVESEQAIYATLNAKRELAVLTGHEATVYVAAFSGDGVRLVTGDGKGEALLWDVATRRPIAKLSGHTDRVRSLEFSAEGSQILTASEDSKLRVFDGATGALLRTMDGHGGPVYAARFAPGNERIVSCSKDQTVRVWDAGSGQELARMTGHEDRINDLVFTRDGRFLITASDDHRLGVWDLSINAHVRWLEWHRTSVYQLALSADGRSLATASADGWPQVWDLTDADPMQWRPRFENGLQGHEGEVYQTRFAGDGAMLVSASADETARIWTLQVINESRVLKGHRDRVHSARFSRNGRRVVTSSSDGTARVWDAGTGEQIVVLRAHRAGLYLAEFSPDDRLIVTASEDHTVRIWDSETSREIAAFPSPEDRLRHANPIVNAEISRDGKLIVSSSLDKSAIVWDLTKGSQTRFVHGEAVWESRFSPDGKRIATASDDKTAAIWDVSTGTRLAELKQHSLWVSRAVFSPDGHLILTTSGDKTAGLWDAGTGKLIRLLQGHEGALTWGEFSPDGQHVVTSSSDATVRIWDVATGHQIRQWNAGNARLCARYSLNGGMIAATGTDGVVLVYDVRKDALKWRLWKHDARSNYAVFDPSGKHLASVSHDGSIKIWKMATGALLHTLRGHDGYVAHAEFSTDGTLLISAASDSTVRLWSTLTGVQIGVVTGHSDTVAVAGFIPGGHRVYSASRDKSLRVWQIGSGGNVLVPGYTYDATQEARGHEATAAGEDAGRTTIRSVRDLIVNAQLAVPRCLTRDERRAARLDDLPPAWCIDRKLWPYHTKAWTAWQASRRRGVIASPPDDQHDGADE